MDNVFFVSVLVSNAVDTMFLCSALNANVVRNSKEARRNGRSNCESLGSVVTDHTTQHNTTQHNTTQHNTTQHNTTQHNTTQHNTTQHNTQHTQTPHWPKMALDMKRGTDMKRERERKMDIFKNCNFLRTYCFGFNYRCNHFFGKNFNLRNGF